jgi:hypothetical protein
MKFRLQGSVTIPKRPSSVGGLLSWARGVNRTLQELRDRKIVGAVAKGKGGGTITQGPFCKVYQDDPNWKLTGGSVIGGSGNVAVADNNLGTISSPPANGTFYWLVCSGTAVVEDSVLLPGFTLSTVTVASGSSIPSNTIPTAAAPAGVLRISLGSWSNGVFVPAGCGNIQIFHCPGTLSYSRV